MPLNQTSASPARPKVFPLLWWLMPACLLVLLGGITFWQPRLGSIVPLQNTIQQLAPGLTLRKFPYQTPAGLTQIYFVRGEKKAGWRLQMALAKGTVLQRETVTQIAARENAPVAVNGGFFAYEGAALGAVKKEGEWVRLPWKNRTAIGFKSDGSARIANLRGTVSLKVGDITLDGAALNGNPPQDGAALLTPRYGTTYKLKPGSSAFEVTDGKISSIATEGIVNIRAGKVLIVATGAAAQQLAATALADSASWKINVTPADWDDYSTILGAGPRLVTEGVAAEASQEEEFRPDVLQRGSRTGVGIDANGDALFVIADGNDFSTPGLTLPELATVMVSLGARDALHMDCGPSSVLIVNNKITNRPWANQPSGLNEPTVPNALFMTRPTP